MRRGEFLQEINKRGGGKFVREGGQKLKKQ